MKKFLLLFLIICSSFFVKDALADSLITSSNMTYLGAFTVTDISNGSQSTEYGGTAIAFNPNGNGGAGSLLMNGFNNSGPYVAEISIPSSLYTGTDTSALDSSPYIASFVSPNSASPYFWDISEGHYTNVGSGGADMSADCSNGWGTGGLFISGTTIYANSYCRYPQPATMSIFPTFTHTEDPLSKTGSYAGNYALNIYTTAFPSSVGNTGDLTAGALASVPPAYQSQLGGTMLVGNNPWGASIIQRSSMGPSITVFNPSNFSAANTFPASSNAMMLAGYPFSGSHMTLGAYASGMAGTQYISIADQYAAIAFPPNSRSVLVIGQHGIGNYGVACSGMATSGISCYGTGTSDCSEVCMSASEGGGNYPGVPLCPTTGTFSCGGTTQNPGSNCCYDPSTVGNTHGNTAWPYQAWVWAYDVGDSSGNNTSGNSVSSMNATYPGKNNLTAVKLGLINPWDLYPYATWSLPVHFPFPGTSYCGDTGQNNSYAGGTYDPVSGKLYLSIYDGDRPNAPLPAFEVYQISTGSSSTQYTITPSAGANGSISPSGSVLVNSGNTQQFTVTPGSGYTATVAGTCGGALSGTTYTTKAITANCTVSATFSQTVLPPPTGVHLEQ